MLSKLSKAVLCLALFISATLMLWLLNENGSIPEIIFMLGFGIVILICVGIMFYPSHDEWKNVTFIKKKK